MEEMQYKGCEFKIRNKDRLLTGVAQYTVSRELAGLQTGDFA